MERLLSINSDTQPLAPASTPSQTHERIFSQFITHTLYTLLGLYPASSHSLHSNTFISKFDASVDSLHLLLSSVASIIPLPIVVYALKLVSKIAATGRRVAQGSEMYLFAVALILSNKISDDKPYACKCWVKLLNMPTAHITLLEREFLDCVKFDVAIPFAEYNCWVDKIQASAKGWMQSSRGQQSPPLSPFTKRRF